LAVIVAFAIALTVLRADYSRAAAEAAAAKRTSSTEIVVAAPPRESPAWVLGILALVAPLIGMLAEFPYYDPRAHRARRAERFYSRSARKVRLTLRLASPLRRARLALLSFENPVSRDDAMMQVIAADHGDAAEAEPTRLRADEPVRQLRRRIAAYDTIAPVIALLVLNGPPDASAREAVEEALTNATRELVPDLPEDADPPVEEKP
jgi:hypothetical protein